MTVNVTSLVSAREPSGLLRSLKKTPPVTARPMAPMPLAVRLEPCRETQSTKMNHLKMFSNILHLFYVSILFAFFKTKKKFKEQISQNEMKI